MDLDDSRGIRQLDAGNMLDRIQELPQQCAVAWEQCERLRLPWERDAFDRIVIVGMGGSAIGGALLEGLVADQCPIPLTVVRDVTLPAFASGPDTLVMACSYSGNTEETLSCFEQALTRGTAALAVTTGGQLATLARSAGAPVVALDYQSQPRAALGFSFTLLLGIAHRLGLIKDPSSDLMDAVQVMEAWQSELGPEVPKIENGAKQLAAQIHGRLPVTYGAGFLAAVANRWKTQFNENAKHWAFFEILPELNHNTVVGFGVPVDVRELAVVLLLRSDFDPPRIQERWDVTLELLDREGVSAGSVSGRGESELAQMLSLIQFGDYVSYYLAVCNDIDPTPVDNIRFLKRRLAELGRVVP